MNYDMNRDSNPAAIDYGKLVLEDRVHSSI